MIYDWSREQAHKNKNQIAISLLDEHVSYGLLEAESNRLAGKLLDGGFNPGDRAGLFMEKTPLTIIAMLGISKAGGVYVPLDFHSPAERVLKIIKSADLSLVFIDHHSSQYYQDVLHLEPALSFLPWIWWSAEILENADDVPPKFRYHEIGKMENHPHGVIRDQNSAAHILFTSGSTGDPKGVVITHKNVHSFIEWAVPYFNMKTGENTSCHSPLHFDLSTFDIFGAFAAGSHVHLLPAKINVNPKKLSGFILDNKLTQWFSVPSALSYMARFNAIPEGGFPDLKRLIWCGEVFPTPALQYWMKNLPGVQFTNLYGPTEATIASSYYTVPEIPGDSDEIPIGRPCSGEKLIILNDNLNRVEPGETGDLYIAGDGLSPGYWLDKAKTDAAFILYKNEEGKQERIYKTGDLASLNDEGLVYFHGRSDYQIKSRGYRIELGEIEAAIGQYEELREYAVVPVKKSGFEGTAIGCAYVGAGKKNGDLSPVLKKKLLGKIPAYMMPQYWKEFDQLPRNGNGKIDRRKLSDYFENN